VLAESGHHVVQLVRRKARFSGRLTWKHCLRRVCPRAGETVEIIFADRLRVGWRRPDAAELRANAKAGGDPRAFGSRPLPVNCKWLPEMGGDHLR